MIRGQGMPSYRHHDFGNLYVHFDVKFPQKGWTSDPAAFEALRNILPAQIAPVVPPPETMTEFADLEELDPSQQARAVGGATGEEEDEDGHPAGAERVQCASQ